MGISPGRDPLAAELSAIVGAEHVLVEPALRAGYEVDWTRRFSGSARLVVRPGGTAEVARVLRACSKHVTPVVPQGGNTGLVGGGVPRRGEVVLTLRRLDQLGGVDKVALQITAAAGVPLARLQAAAAQAGLAFGVDFAARDSATVGGMLATNAGGVHALRHGSMRAQLVGMEAVLASGEIISRMPGLPKDNAGYALPELLVGSEGTLAVITQARLRLVPAPRHVVVALVALDPRAPLGPRLSEGGASRVAPAAGTSPMAAATARGAPAVGLTAPAAAAHATAAAVRLVGRARVALPSLDAAELFFEDGLALVQRHLGGERPFRAPQAGYLLLECAADVDPTDALAGLLDGAPEVADAVLVADPSGRGRLWRLREGHTEAIAAEGIPHKLDVSVPLGRLAELVAGIQQAVAGVDSGARTILFGHAGDGNLHVNLLGLAPDDERADEAVLRLVARLGGSISAEHGIGIAKRRWLGLTRGPADIAAMLAIKRALDPAGLLNPGVLLPERGR
ncbi:MAG: FAD-binding oxidoreductase [Candidatus Limnocylindrales bacterium]